MSNYAVDVLNILVGSSLKSSDAMRVYRWTRDFVDLQTKYITDSNSVTIEQIQDFPSLNTITTKYDMNHGEAAKLATKLREVMSKGIPTIWGELGEDSICI